jgi:serine protease
MMHGDELSGRDFGDEHRERIAIRFAERNRVPYNDAALSAVNRMGLIDWDRLTENFGDLQLAPLFESQPAERIRSMIDEARELDPDYVPGDFSQWFQVICPPGINGEEVASQLRQNAAVESSFVMRPGPPPVNPGDDPRVPNQGYLGAAPNGIDASYAWGFPGGDGDGIGFVDMEQGWNLNHEDLAGAAVTIISGTNQAYFSHGTSVLGEVVMTDNHLGGVGIAPGCTGRVISQHRPSGAYNTPDTIVDAAANMAYGDVLILEAQEHSPVDGTYYWPVEIFDPTYEAIRLATALGIVVVEAACNGGYDLDNYTDPNGKAVFNRTSGDFRDSGAIMVGGATAAAPHSGVGFNFGSRVDCYGWGQNVDTTATNGTGTDNNAYTASFGGTSSATPIVGGAAVIVQGLARANLGHRFSPREIRKLLTTNGTPSANPATDKIGVMPNLRAIIDGNQLALAPDVYLRDYVGDNGNPTAGAVSMSPDIIVKQVSVANPEAAFGLGSGTEANPALSDPVDGSHDNYLYVRVLNRGGSDAPATEVDLYWSPPSTLVTPNLWHPIGTAALADVPSGNVLTLSNEVVWHQADIPGSGHYCFVAVAGTAADPRPDPATFADWNQYVTYVRNNNNVAWRNFDITQPPSDTESEHQFGIAGAFDTSRRFSLGSIGGLPKGSRVTITMPTWLAQGLRPRHALAEYAKDGQSVTLPVRPQGEQHLGEVLLHKAVLADCMLRVHIPEERRCHSFEFAIRQLFEGEELGRLTWRFEGRDEPKRKQRRVSRKG